MPENPVFRTYNENPNWGITASYPINLTQSIGAFTQNGGSVSFCVSVPSSEEGRGARNLAYRAAESNEEDFLSIDLTPPVVQAGTSDDLIKQDTPTRPTFLKRFNERK